MADILISKSWTSVIFEGKNQAYGAFELRGLYDKNINKALIISITIFTLAIAAPLIASLINVETAAEEVVEVKSILLAPPPVDPNTPPPPPPPKIELPKAIASIKFLPPKVEEDEKVTEEEPPAIDDMKDKAIATETVKGESIADNVIEEPKAAPVVEEVKDEIFLVVEEMPEFEGGQSALARYITNNLKIPRQAINMGIQGKVIVSFVVDKTGEITNVEVLKGIGGGCDEEAARVIKKMPKWKAGRQNGRSVTVKYTMPIRFTLE
jgi:periplasmic protein TonB